MSAPWVGDRSVGLPIGTRVWNRQPGARARFGTVMPHEPLYSHGSFPVCFDDHIWRIMDVSYVTAVSAEQEDAIRSQRNAKRRQRPPCSGGRPADDPPGRSSARPTTAAGRRLSPPPPR
ncbi:MAG: hypothetical protein ACRDTD_20245, partial [Pseudonocardiaceae bacterium]